MNPLRNIRLLVEYDGTRYHGWQRQAEAVTIQQVLEESLNRLTGEKVALIGSGRTDAGVHARGQVANFRTASPIPLQAFHKGMNSLLPKDIAVLEAAEAEPSFHARKSARAKTYEYRILNRPTRSPLYHHHAWWIDAPLDLAAMAGAAGALPGEHDFTAFRASGSDNLNPVRRVLAAEWRHDVRGVAHLHHHGHRVSPGHGAEPGGHHGRGGARQGAAGDPGGTAFERRPAPGRTHGAAPGALSGGSVLWRVSSEQ